MNVKKRHLPEGTYTKGWSITPWIIVIHFTAGYTEKQCWEVLKKRKLSVHNGIGRNGDVAEYVTTDNRAWQACYVKW